MKRIITAVIAVIMVFILAAGAALPGYAAAAAPVAENFEIKTFRNTSVGGKLSAYSADGDIVGYEISTQPVKGELRVSDGGLFIYTPNENRRGRDYFGYRALDDAGNYSQEATVIIKIEKQKKDVLYSDMENSADEYAAVALCENGIFTGEQLCGKYCFFPEKPVSRAEFLAMCMELSGEPIFPNVLSTGFADDADISSFIKGYVATASLCGADIDCGMGEIRIFAPGADISVKEAARMLDSIIELSSVSYLYEESDDRDAKLQSCMKLTACGALSPGQDTNAVLTRADAARMLNAALDVLNKR